METRHFLVSGRVQGVGFRYFVRTTAVRLHLTGWVRNTPDGAVECVARGQADKLALFSDELQKGPPLAKVTGVTERQAPDLTLEGFEIRH